MRAWAFGRLLAVVKSITPGKNQGQGPLQRHLAEALVAEPRVRQQSLGGSSSRNREGGELVGGH